MTLTGVISKFKRKERKNKSKQVTEDEVESNRSDEDHDDELIDDVSESGESSEPVKASKAKTPKSVPKKANGTTAKRKRSKEESYSKDEPVKRPRRAATGSESLQRTSEMNEQDNGTSPEPTRRVSERSRAKSASDQSDDVTPVTSVTTNSSAPKSNGSANRSLSQSSSDRDLQILTSKLQVICARLGGKQYQNLTLAKLRSLDEVC